MPPRDPSPAARAARPGGPDTAAGARPGAPRGRAGAVRLGPVLLPGLLPCLLLGLALGLLPGCERRLDARAEGPLALGQNLWRAGRLEVRVPADEVERVAPHAARWAGTFPDLEVVVGPLAEGVDGHGGRLLVAAPGHELARPLLERAGVRWLDGAPDDDGGGGGPRDPVRVELQGRAANLADLTFVLSRLDPLRPGLPVTLLADADPGRRAANLAHLVPGWRGELLVLRRGEAWLEVPLDPDGAPVPDAAVEHAPRRARELEAYRRADGLVDDWTVYADGRVSDARLTAYLERLGQVRARLAPLLAGGPGPVPDEGWTLLAEADLDGFARADAAAHDLARADLPSRTLIALLPEAAGADLDDGGQAWAEALVRGALGPPAERWLAEALAASATDAFDPGLVERVLGSLSPDELRAALTDEADGLRSHLLLRLVRGALVRGALSAEDADGETGTGWFLRAWEGRPGAHGALVELALAVRAERGGAGGAGGASDDDTRTETPTGATSEAAGPDRPTRGLLVTAPPGSWAPAREGAPALGFGTAACARSLGQLAELGANTAGYCFDLCLDDDPGTGRAWRPRRGFGALQGDAGLRLALAQGSAAGLDAWLEPTLLERRSGLPAGDLVRVTPERWDDLFVALEAAAEHAALLGALDGAGTLDLAADLAEAMRTRWTLAEPENEVQAAARARKERGWSRVVARARGLFPGRVTASAAQPATLEWMGFRPELDLCTSGFFPRLHTPEGEEPHERVAGRRMAALLLPAVDAARALGQDLVLAPVGFRATEHAWRGPGEDGGAADPAKQAELVWSLEQALAHLRGRGEPEPGVLLWRWSTDPDAGGPDHRDFVLNGSPALEVLRNWWRR